MVKSSRPPSTSTWRQTASRLALVALAVLGAAACRSRDASDPLSARAGEKRLYVISCESCVTPIPLHRLHCWTVHVRTPDGRPVDGALVRVDGGMPSHGHGLPAVPSPGEPVGQGDYRVEGVKFQMPGHWRMVVAVQGPAGADTAVFEMDLS